MWALTILNGLGYGQVGPSSDSFKRTNFVSSYHLQRSVPYQPVIHCRLKKCRLTYSKHNSFIICTGLR